VGGVNFPVDLLNTMANLEAALIILARKGLITQMEFDVAKREAIERLKQQFPELGLQYTA
jgi:hypothetical protein